jgi:serine/threonine protein kinase
MTLNEIETLLTKSPKAIFGADIDAEERRLLAACHPDLHGGDVIAAELFKRVKSLASQLRKPPVIIKGKRHTYSLGQLLWTGDVSDIFTAEADGAEYLLKVSRVPGADGLLNNESDALSKIHKAATDTKYRLYVPLLVETIQVRDKFPKRINVFHRESGVYSLPDVIAKHGRLDGRHLGWIFKRLLTILGFAHQQGIVHGAVLPPHIVLNPDNHGLCLVGWGQSVKSGSPLSVALKSHRDWYPPEVAAKKPATAATDIYMAAKCALHLTGGSMPSHFQGFLNACLLDGQSMRPDDAWSLYDEFDDLLRRVYGPPKFHVLSMS